MRVFWGFCRRHVKVGYIAPLGVGWLLANRIQTIYGGMAMSLPVEYGDVALAAWERYKSFSAFRSYCSILAMTGAARLGKILGSEA